MLTRSAMAVTLFLVMGTVQAEDSRVTSMDKQEFATYEAQVNKDLSADKRYHEITPDDLQTVKSKFAAMDELWQHADSAGKLNPDDVSAIESDLASVDKILHHAAIESRVICQDDTQVGTHISRTLCRTQAQIDSETSHAHAELNTMQNDLQTTKAGH